MMNHHNTSSQQLATESFSYSWLSSSPDEFFQHKTISTTSHNNNNFDFDISMSKSTHSSLVHADKLFSNGLILPRSLDESSEASASTIIVASSSTTSSSAPSPLLVSSRIDHHHHHPSSSSFRRIFLGKWSKFNIPGKIVLGKYIKCLVPMKRSMGRRVDDVNRLTWEVKISNNNNNNTPEIAFSPRKDDIIAAYSSAWNYDDIDESSIRDAILYCKRSSGFY